MGPQKFRKAVALAAVCGAFTGLIGCGGNSTPAPIATTVTTLTEKVTAAAAISETAAYVTALEEWTARFAALAEGPGASILEFEDPLQPTDGEMARAREFIETMRSSVAELKTIEPPAEVARAHAQLRAALGGELTAFERLVSALDWGSERDAELAYRQHEESLALLMKAAKNLEPYVDLSDVTQN